MKVARVRISRVRMKAGGADVRVLRRDTQSPVAVHLREWTDHIMSSEDRPPDAYASIALWFDPDNPGWPRYSATHCTTHDAIPAPVLVRMAADYLVSDHAAASGKNRAIVAMGGTVEGWSPDDAG